MSHNLSAPSPRKPKEKIHFPPTDSSSGSIPAFNPPSFNHNTRRSVSSTTYAVQRSSYATPSRGVRRRIHSVDLDNRNSNRPRTNRIDTPGSPLHALDSGNAGAFSDEYDLSHEDPRILQDVERILKVKARREARLKLGGAQSISAPSYRHGLDSVSPPTSPNRHPLGTPHTSEPSPSKGHYAPPSVPAALTSNSSLAHFAPTSVDGRILDWGGYNVEKDKSEWRWSLTGRHKGKEKEHSDLVDIQIKEREYEEKLRKIRALASPATKAKAASLKEHFSNRYKRLDDYIHTYQEPLNLADISRWWADQSAAVRTAITKAEPFIWLKDSPAALHPRWFLTSLIIREYFASQVFRQDSMATIHEDSSLNIPTPQMENTYPSPSQLSRGGQSKRRSWNDMSRTSFDPFPESTTSHDPEYNTHHSADGSVYSSIFGGSSTNVPRSGSVPSPSSSRHYLREVVALRRLHQNDSDDGLSSARNSVSERSEDGVAKLGREVRHTTPEASLDAKPKPETATAAILQTNLEVESPQPLKLGAPSLLIPPTKPSLSTASSPITSAAAQRRYSHRYLPLLDAPQEPNEQDLLRQVADEARVKHEYELKSVLLEQSIAQNQRIRHILNRVALSIREYESAQTIFGTGVVSNPKNRVPLDVLESLGHDPANVTGATRKFQGWRAVEDIYFRLARQRETLSNYLASASTTSSFDTSVFDSPIESLIQALDELASKKVEVGEKALQVSEKLDETRKMHATVKQEYNDTLAHVSVVYPELSQIVALEESYKDQYQHFWDIGMDALTFLLDTVTPFWRTYGKTIGDDIRDFLIVPLYRNEFTGEAKRYPIKHLPSRSFRHYVGLILFFTVSVCVCLLQGRAAITSATHYRLMWIEHSGVRWVLLPFFWISILIQWTATLLEFCVVLMQLWMVLWWLAWLTRLTS